MATPGAGVGVGGIGSVEGDVRGILQVNLPHPWGPGMLRWSLPLWTNPVWLFTGFAYIHIRFTLQSGLSVGCELVEPFTFVVVPDVAVTAQYHGVILFYPGRTTGADHVVIVRGMYINKQIWLAFEPIPFPFPGLLGLANQ